MLVFAHRGLHQHVPENTMASFEAAVAAGVDGIEIDVRVTKDRVPIVFHDASVRRRKVRSMTRDDLSKVSRREVPTLEEALDRFDVAWDVEIKSADAVAPTIRVLRRFRRTRRMTVTSFRPDVLVRVCRTMKLDCGRILARAPIQGRRNAGKIWVWERRIVTPGRVAREHARHRQVWVYGPRTKADHERLVALGVDAIITDWPERIPGRASSAAN
jgi:glycerophosphoryl diester phosphodiesterase